MSTPTPLPLLNEELVAEKLRLLRKQHSILEMERLSGVSRQVLYRIMGGSSINRSPYELVVKILFFLQNHYPDQVFIQGHPWLDPVMQELEIKKIAEDPHLIA